MEDPYLAGVGLTRSQDAVRVMRFYGWECEAFVVRLEEKESDAGMLAGGEMLGQQNSHRLKKPSPDNGLRRQETRFPSIEYRSRGRNRRTMRGDWPSALDLTINFQR